MKVYNCLGLVLGYIPDLRRPSPEARGEATIILKKLIFLFRTELTCLGINQQGTMVATASTKVMDVQYTWII